MRSRYLFCLITFFSAIILTGSTEGDRFPQRVITNGEINCKIYLPDGKKGYYRSTRFDWAGVIPELEFRGHSFFGKWFEKYNPFVHDAIQGPVESFSPLPLGDESIDSAGKFVKIGIGVIEKPRGKTYNQFRFYRIVDPGKWKIKSTRNSVEFIHVISTADLSYEYKKVIKLVPGENRLILEHSLKNTGKQTIKTDSYNHNFFVMDSQIVGPNRKIIFPFDIGFIEPDSRLTNNIKLIDGKQITFKHQFSQQETAYTVLDGFSDDIRDYDIKIEDSTSSTGVRIRGNQPLSKLVFWASYKTACPEPYIDIEVKPGEEFDWDIVYDFYVL